MASTHGHGGSPSHSVPDYWWYQARSALLRTALGRYAAGAASALDLGSADGPSVAWFRETVPHTASLDIDPRGLGHNGICGSGLALPFADGSFDVVSAFDVIEHLEPEETALAQIHRVLRPGGVLLLSVPAYQWAWTDHDVANGHHRRYTRPRARAAVQQAGFTVERATYAFTSVFPAFVAERMVRRLRSSRHTHAADIVDVPAIPTALHHALMALSRVDDAMLRRADLPFGSSVFLAARKQR